MPAALRYTTIALLLGAAVALPVSARELPLDARVQRLERMLDNRVMIQLLQRMESLQSEVRQLRGLVETQANEIQSMAKRSRDLYLDTDTRLQALEGRRLGALEEDLDEQSLAELTASADRLIGDDQAAPESSALVRPPAGAEEPQSLYDAAYLELVNGRYKAASDGFRQLLSRHPQGAIADNARYWLGETYYVQRQFEQAQAQFAGIVEHNPESPKIADATVKLGFVQHELGEIGAARRTLLEVLDRYPGSTAALLAERRLGQLPEG